MHQDLVTKFFNDVWNKGDMEAADDIFAGAHINHDPNHTWTTRGAEGMKRLVAVYRNAFPDLRISVDECLWAEPFVVTRWTLQGTHLGRLFRIAPTGRHIEVTGMQFDRFESGRIIETWSQWDMLGLVEQIGMLPARVREDTEDVDLAYWKTHKMWWQADQRGRDEHELLDDPGPRGQ
jgi:steroid delta-isomerase-like uncharacterized protein